MKLEEVGNGSGTSYVFSEDEYIRSLDYGWKIGATNNADTHSPYWGSNTPHRTGVWMPSLTKADLLDALQARRTFATEDVNYELGLKANGAWMGSEIPNTGSLAFEITGFDPDGEGATLVQLITFGGDGRDANDAARFGLYLDPDRSGDARRALLLRQGHAARRRSHRVIAHLDQGQCQCGADRSRDRADHRHDLQSQPDHGAPDQSHGCDADHDRRRSRSTAAKLPRAPPPCRACVIGPCVDAYPSITWQPLVTGPVTVTAR